MPATIADELLVEGLPQDTRDAIARVYGTAGECPECGEGWITEGPAAERAFRAGFRAAQPECDKLRVDAALIRWRMHN